VRNLRIVKAGIVNNDPIASPLMGSVFSLRSPSLSSTSYCIRSCRGILIPRYLKESHFTQSLEPGGISCHKLSVFLRPWSLEESEAENVNLMLTRVIFIKTSTLNAITAGGGL
jgi:hypothetical protein